MNKIVVKHKDIVVKDNLGFSLLQHLKEVYNIDLEIIDFTKEGYPLYKVVNNKKETKKAIGVTLFEGTEKACFELHFIQ